MKYGFRPRVVGHARERHNDPLIAINNEVAASKTLKSDRGRNGIERAERRVPSFTEPLHGRILDRINSTPKPTAARLATTPRPQNNQRHLSFRAM
jgi:hypothetical protein